MLRLKRRSTRLAGLLIALLASTGTVMTSSAAYADHAENPYSYDDACPGFTLHPGWTMRFWVDGKSLGRVQIGTKESTGAACVATIKGPNTAGHRSYTMAAISNGNRIAVDDDDYLYYAGRNCNRPPPADCSTVWAKGVQVTYRGEIRHPATGVTYWREKTIKLNFGG